MNQQFLTELKAVTAENRIFTDEPMKKHTTVRVGGPADVLIQPKRAELASVIRLCREYDIPYQVIGNGSNLLVGDRGIRGAVIEMLSKKDEICVEDDCITVGAGMLLSKTANCAAEHGLTGMEFAAGIPGSVGGAIVMNAGAYGGEMKDIVEAVDILDADGIVRRYTCDEMQFSYRHSSVDASRIVVRVVFSLQAGDKTAIQARMNELSEARRSKQPLEYPSAGSTFKRPEGYFAAKLIDDSGLRGYRCGGAMVSEKHCGFVVNVDQATCADVCAVMRHVEEVVKEKYDVTLEPEVRIIR